jgi:hypothetical protein
MRKLSSMIKPIAAYLYERDICFCDDSNKHKACVICWGALEAAWDKEYAKLKAEGMEDYLEAKEFMWDFFEKRDKKRNIKWTY